MRLSNPFKRKASTDDAGGEIRPSAGGDAVERVRTRTRQRLIGALVLVTVGVIGFPLIFETQPRPIPVDIAIELPKPETAPALALPPHRKATGSVPAVGDASPTSSAPTAAVPPVVRDVPAEAEVPVTAASTATSKEADRTESPAPAAKASAAVSRPEAAAPKAAAAADKGAASAAATARFVVQVGAFADPDAARDVRAKMEKLGLKTYTQVADTGSGKRIRVRLGPFATRAEADKAMARSRDAGVAAVVLTL